MPICFSEFSLLIMWRCFLVMFLEVSCFIWPAKHCHCKYTYYLIKNTYYLIPLCNYWDICLTGSFKVCCIAKWRAGCLLKEGYFVGLTFFVMSWACAVITLYFWPAGHRLDSHLLSFELVLVPNLFMFNLYMDDLHVTMWHRMYVCLFSCSQIS